MNKTNDAGLYHSPNYYFINKYVTFGQSQNYNQTLIAFFINTNSGRNNGKSLLVQNEQGFWAICRRTLKPDVHIDIFEAFIELISDELGFRGVIPGDINPNFNVLGYIFDFARQDFDQTRILDQKAKGRDIKGKSYHLMVIEYKGADELPFEKRLEKKRIADYKWVDYQEGMQLLNLNRELLKDDKTVSKVSVDFHIKSHERIINIVKDLARLRQNQLSLI